MRVAVLGATGGTGSRITDLLLDAGHQVVAYVRRPEAMSTRPGLTVVGGRLDEELAMAKALAGVTAVVVAIGPEATPAAMASPSLMRDTLPHVVAVMHEVGARRLVLLSAMGVGDSAEVGSSAAKMVYRTILRGVYADKVAAEATLEGAGLDVTRVLPVMLTDEPDDPAAEVRDLSEVTVVQGTPRVSRATVARVMVEALTDPATIGRRIVVSAPGTIR